MLTIVAVCLLFMKKSKINVSENCFLSLVLFYPVWDSYWLFLIIIYNSQWFIPQ